MDPSQCPRAVGPDDGDLLHAVMAFLDDSDAMPVDLDLDETTNDSYSSSHSDASSSPTHKHAPAIRKAPPGDASSATHSGVLPRLQPRRPKINRSRERMRKETLALRERVLELQDRLEVLQGGVSSKVGIAPPQNNVRERENGEARRLRALAWQAVAEHEIGKKQAAEEERERLRALLKEQKLAFRRLRRYLGKYSADSVWAPLKKDLLVDDEVLEDDTAEPTPVKPTPSGLGDFDDITRTLPTMYMQTGAVFADQRLENLVSSVRDVTFQNALTPSMSVEALDSRLVPFDVAQTAKAVWEFHRRKVRKPLTTGESQVEECEDAIRRVFTSSIDHPCIVGTARVRMETRRYVEQDRVVLVQSAIYDQMLVDKVPVHNYGLRQFQWTVIGPPRHDVMRRSGKTMAQVEVFEVTVPILDHVTGIERSDLLMRMKTLCETTAEVHMEIERESVESILMDSLLSHSPLNRSMVQPPQIAMS